MAITQKISDCEPILSEAILIPEEKELFYLAVSCYTLFKHSESNDISSEGVYADSVSI